MNTIARIITHMLARLDFSETEVFEVLYALENNAISVPELVDTIGLQELSQAELNSIRTGTLGMTDWYMSLYLITDALRRQNIRRHLTKA